MTGKSSRMMGTRMMISISIIPPMKFFQREFLFLFTKIFRNNIIRIFLIGKESMILLMKKIVSEIKIMTTQE